MKSGFVLKRLLPFWIVLVLIPSFAAWAQPSADTTFTNPRRLGFGHIYGIAWSPDGKTLALAAEGGVYLLPYQEGTHAIDRLHGRLLPMDRVIARSIAFRPDGAEFAVGLQNGTVRLLDFPTGKLKATLKGSSPIIDKVAYSPNGQWIAFADADAVHVFDEKTGSLQRTVPGHSALSFSPDSTLIASPSEGDTVGAFDHAVRVWDIQSGKETYRLSTHDQTLHSVAFSPDGTQILAGGENGTILRWFLKSGNKVSTSYTFDFSSPTYATQSLDNSVVQDITFNLADPGIAAATILVSNSTTGLIVWNIGTGETILNQVFESDIQSVTFQPHENIIAIGGTSDFELWNVPDQKKLLNIVDVGLRLLCCENRTIYLSADPRYIVWEQRIFDSQTGIEIGEWYTDLEITTGSTVSQDGTLVALWGSVGDGDGMVIYAIKPSAIDVQVTKVAEPATVGVITAAFHADDSLVYLDADKTIKVLAPRSDKIIHTYTLPGDQDSWALPSRLYILTPSENGTVAIHRLSEISDYTITANGTIHLGDLAMLKQTLWYGIAWHDYLTLYSSNGGDSVLQKAGDNTWQGTVFDSAGALRVIGTYSRQDPLNPKSDPPLKGLDETRISQITGAQTDQLFWSPDYTFVVTADSDGSWVWDWHKK